VARGAGAPRARPADRRAPRRRSRARLPRDRARARCRRGEEGPRGSPGAPAGRGFLHGPAREAPRAREPHARPRAGRPRLHPGARPVRDPGVTAWGTFALAAATSSAVAWLAARAAPRAGLVDDPAARPDRKRQARPVPAVGG